MASDSSRSPAAVRGQAREADALDDVGAIVSLIGDAPVVLLGEATHGTHEFYRLRAKMTHR